MSELKRICPLMSTEVEDGAWYCEETECAWWHEVEQCCAVLLIAVRMNKK